jgi:Asp-tRNA(Asn)/Glu-tRNA(Gln) amidotransferase A subunit family amidase
MRDDISFIPATELKKRIAAKDISPVEVVDAALKRLHEVEPVLNNFATLTEDVARQAAKDAEAAVLKGEPLGLLHGIPVSVKDLITMGGVKCSFGSRSAADNIAGDDAPSVERVKAQGACILGKTTTSEFGCKPVGDSPLTGITRNPWNTDKTPGGSSCGAAASIAAGVTPFGLGTDGGGSVRIPAHFSGLFAIKAHFGRVPVYPASATPTLAHVGPLARTVRDGALLLSAIAGYEPRDPFSVAEPLPDFVAACDLPIKGKRIAWSPTFGYAQPDAEVVSLCEQAVRVLEDHGCEVELVENVMDGNPSDMWMAEFYAGVGTRLKDVLANEPDMLDPAVVEVLSGALDQSLEAYYAKVFQRYEFRERMRAFFEKYDLLVSPTLPVSAFDVGLNVPPQIPDANIISWVAYTYPFNLTGYPAASVPAGFTDEGLPVGLQIVGGPLRETDIFAAAAAIEISRPWANKHPAI